MSIVHSEVLTGTHPTSNVDPDTNPTGGTMSTTEDPNEASAGGVDMKLEVVVIPVSDVDRAKEFYARLGWRLDADVATGDDFRLVQLTPPGSGCSVQFGTNLTSAAPGSLQSTYLIVADIAAVRDELAKSGVEVSEVFHWRPGAAGSGPTAPRARQRARPR